MSEMMDDIAYLSREIGARPAGTEEERLASEYIASQFRTTTNLRTKVEEFSCNAQPGMVEVICFGGSIFVTLISVFLPFLAWIALLVTAVLTGLYAAEVMNRPLLSRVFMRGVSQNVVARYNPGDSRQTRARKVILVASYDSDKVRPEINGLGAAGYSLLFKASYGALVALSVLWFIRAISQPTGVAATVFTIIMLIVALLCVLPVASFGISRVAQYNEAANHNASGVAALIELARRISGTPLASSRDQATIHGEDAVYAANVVPEGAELVYEVDQTTEESTQENDKQRVAEQALVGDVFGHDPIESPTPEQMNEYRQDTYEVLSGKTYRQEESLDVSEQAVSSSSIEQYDDQQVDQTEEVSEAADQAVVEELPQGTEEEKPAKASAQVYVPSGEVPDWYKSAQAKARKSNHTKPVKRSRYAEALDAAVAESRLHFEEANKVIGTEAGAYVDSLQRGIKEVEAPVDAATRPSAVPKVAPGIDVSEQLSVNRPMRNRIPVSKQHLVSQNDEANMFDDVKHVSEESTKQDIKDHVDLPEEPMGSTTAMEPIDVSTLREITDTIDTENSESKESAPSRELTEVERLQKAPSRKIAPVTRRAANRVVVDHEDDQSPYATQDEIDPFTAHYDAPSNEAISQARNQQTQAEHSFNPSQAAQAFVQAASNSLVDVPEVTPEVQVPSVGELKQRAPLAAKAEDSGETAAKSLLSSRLPRVNPDSTGAISIDQMQLDNKIAALRNTLPSMSGSISAVSPKSASHSTVSTTGAFVPAGATGSFAPVGDELVADVAPDELYVDDADDSVFEASPSDSGAFAAPGIMDMPKRRLGLFSRLPFGKKKHKEQEQSASEWLNVDEDFNPTAVGAARGGWESFQEDSDYYQNQPFERDSRDEMQQTTVINPVSDVPHRQNSDNYQDEVVDATDAFEPLSDEEFYKWDENPDSWDRTRKWNGGALSKARAMAQELSNRDSRKQESSRPSRPGRSRNQVDAMPSGFADVANLARSMSQQDDVNEAEIEEERQEILDFKNPDISTEVWFVALGSTHAGNGGMKAFMAEHADELRGALIINLESVGKGQLMYLDQDGAVLNHKPSTRLKRYLRVAAQSLGIKVAPVRIDWRDTPASVAMASGLQAVTLSGIEAGKPALFGQGDDVLENIDESALELCNDYVVEVLKNI